MAVDDATLEHLTARARDAAVLATPGLAVIVVVSTGPRIATAAQRAHQALAGEAPQPRSPDLARPRAGARDVMRYYSPKPEVRAAVLAALRHGHRRLAKIVDYAERLVPGAHLWVDVELRWLRQEGLVNYVHRSPGIEPGWRLRVPELEVVHPLPAWAVETAKYLKSLMF